MDFYPHHDYDFWGINKCLYRRKSFTPPDRIVHFSLPDILKFNTLVVLFSSITMQLGINAAKVEDRKKALTFLSITFGLGLIFFNRSIQCFCASYSRGTSFRRSNKNRQFGFLFLYVYRIARFTYNRCNFPL